MVVKIGSLTVRATRAWNHQSMINVDHHSDPDITSGSHGHGTVSMHLTYTCVHRAFTVLSDLQPCVSLDPHPLRGKRVLVLCT